MGAMHQVPNFHPPSAILSAAKEWPQSGLSVMSTKNVTGQLLPGHLGHTKA
jgi:hypothetical protein